MPGILASIWRTLKKLRAHEADAVTSLDAALQRLGELYQSNGDDFVAFNDARASLYIGGSSACISVIYQEPNGSNRLLEGDRDRARVEELLRMLYSPTHRILTACEWSSL